MVTSNEIIWNSLVDFWSCSITSPPRDGCRQQLIRAPISRSTLILPTLVDYVSKLKKTFSSSKKDYRDPNHGYKNMREMLEIKWLTINAISMRITTPTHFICQPVAKKSLNIFHNRKTFVSLNNCPPNQPKTSAKIRFLLLVLINPAVFLITRIFTGSFRWTD